MAGSLSEGARLREFWNARYGSFTLSESGWLGAGERLNDRIYACKRQALRKALSGCGLHRNSSFSVLDAGCGQGYFARFYAEEYPFANYVGIDISERAIAHVRQQPIERAEFHVGDLCTWEDPARRTFDIVHSFEVLHLILDDNALRGALTALSHHLAGHGSLLVTAALPVATFERSHYLRYRSRRFWESVTAQLELRIVAEQRMYYWLPNGGPANRYLRYAMACLGPYGLYLVDRAALAMRLPQPPSIGVDSRMRLLTIRWR
jgi:SAM-dependent methyltransferase